MGAPPALLSMVPIHVVSARGSSSRLAQLKNLLHRRGLSRPRNEIGGSRDKVVHRFGVFSP